VFPPLPHPPARLATVLLGLSLSAAPVLGAFLERPLAVSGFDDQARLQVTGLLDLEGWWFERPAPGLVFTDDNHLFNPRATFYLDAQLGARLYVFGQIRADRGYDPSDQDLRLRSDEYALRLTLDPARDLHVQIGKFATVVGTWAPRHNSWDHAFITAPAAYEALTAIWDNEPPGSAGELLRWGFIRPPSSLNQELAFRTLSLPIIWGGSYSTGAALAGRAGHIVYAAEVKNQALSSRPESWDPDRFGWENPTYSGRLAWQPSPTWTWGLSASTGTFLYAKLAAEEGFTPSPGRSLRDYRQTTLAHDITYAWRGWQVWGEIFLSRFEIPGIADADVCSWYLETKYKITPQLFLGARWNEQRYARIDDPAGGRVRWGRNLRRFDLAPGYRFSDWLQLKLQLSLQHEENDPRPWSALAATQLTARF
jgi:hypothetical protein